MLTFKTIIAAVAIAAGMAAAPAFAAEGTAPPVEKQSWSFAGIFGTYDENQLQRGFQVFREVCANCHSARLLAFRNLTEDGGPGFTEGQVKALAAEYEVADATAEGGVRPAVAADRWPSPFATDQDARDANGGVVPPDFSVLAKARGIKDAFPWWITNYFTGYSEGGPDYIHALLNGYHDEAPEGFDLPEGKFYNDYFPGHAIGMGPPLQDELVAYEAGEGQEPVPMTVEQYSHDVAAFMMWLAEPGLVSRKETGFKVLLFLIAFAGLMYATKRKLWQGIEH
ncbi:Ubiquinol cytochrome C oxidoreductase, cytochrome C1 subunit [Devosia sp. LC5]|uniref:cytochrome c1 n=1 Tax=Devosia sp. LC5 TaxID=1502724 RepID=UPI0004E39834|nr:cytochrome c1 [Devosia sp. LC5]KFC61755.1 Ubiquinol cytochrome C oxidoreductase, cytochrome C1 subunit [Devosia sp. LC5]